jgi:hypothetical protein
LYTMPSGATRALNKIPKCGDCKAPASHIRLKIDKSLSLSQDDRLSFACACDMRRKYHGHLCTLNEWYTGKTISGKDVSIGHRTGLSS